MTTEERTTLQRAAVIIRRNLEAGQETRIPGFGKFYLSHVEVYEGQHPMSCDGWDQKDLVTVRTARFRPFGGLKEALNPEFHARKKARREEKEQAAKAHPFPLLVGDDWLL